MRAVVPQACEGLCAASDSTLCRLVPGAEEETAAERVFHQAFIPRRLDEVTHFERDAARIATGGNLEGIYYQTVTGLEADLSGVRTVPVVLQRMFASEPGGAVAEPAVEASGSASGGDQAEGEAEGGGEDGTDSEDTGEEGSSSDWEDRPSGPTRDEVRAARKANKEAVKLAKREQRKVKMPKHLKKKRVKSTSGKK